MIVFNTTFRFIQPLFYSVLNCDGLGWTVISPQPRPQPQLNINFVVNLSPCLSVTFLCSSPNWEIRNVCQPSQLQTHYNKWTAAPVLTQSRAVCAPTIRGTYYIDPWLRGLEFTSAIMISFWLNWHEADRESNNLYCMLILNLLFSMLCFS